ncbi:condensation domain-containing protein [Curtobacterium flaccumfaciens pv. flaccumfaciens]
MSGVAGGSRRSTTTLRSFADSLAEIGRHPSPRADRFWQEVDRAAAAALPRFSPRADAEAQAQARGRARATVQLERTLAPGPTQDSVRAVMRAYGASGEDLLLAALARAFERITGQTQIAVRLERHGRSETRGLPATDRTVGWFTTMYPLVVTAVADPGDAVAAVKDAVRAVPEDGVTYGLRPAGYADITTPLTVNYLGDLGRSTVDGFGSTVFNSAGTSVSPTNAFLPGVRANAMILDSRLVLRISHETTVASEAQVERLADAWLREVEAIGEHCAGIGPRIRTAADFPDAVELTRHDIDVIERFPEHVEDAVELTPLQEGMLVHSLAGGTDYVVQQSYLVADPLRSLLTPSRLATAALAVAARHDALRSAFVTDSLSRPLQFVLAERDVPVAWDDLRGRSATSADIDGLLASDVAHGFDPATDPLLRIRVVRSDATDSTGSAVGEETRLVLTMHHLAVDGWSLSHILSELVDGCRSLAAGASAATVLDRARERRSATAQPRDQVRWIRDQDDGAFTAFWADTLAGYEATAEFTSAGRSPVLDAGAAPNSTTDPSVDAHGVGRLESATASDLRRRLDAAHASSGITVSNLVHAAFALVLGRESGSDDVVFGSVVSGRDHDVSGLADAVGLFINTIPVRVQLAPHLSTDDLLRSVRDQALGSADHAYGSLRTVEDAADLHGSVRCLLAFENHEDRDPAALGLRFDQSREQTNYPVTVAVRPVGDDLAITVLYDSGTITHSDAERIRGRLELVLEQFATDTTRPVSAIRTLDDLHEREVLWCFGANEVPYDRDQTVVDAFLAHARVHPTDVAIVMGEAEYDFATVADAARAVAVAVAARVPRGGRVGLLTTRGPRTAVAMIGTMMAGCAFVALDVDSPDARLLDVLADAAPAVVLTDGDVAHDTALRVTAETRVIRLDGVLEDGPGGGALDPDRLPAPDDVAYCVYTSGSTGRPKGVVLTHRGAGEPPRAPPADVRTAVVRPRPAVREQRLRRLGVGTHPLSAQRCGARRRAEGDALRDRSPGSGTPTDRGDPRAPAAALLRAPRLGADADPDDRRRRVEPRRRREGSQRRSPLRERIRSERDHRARDGVGRPGRRTRPVAHPDRATSGEHPRRRRRPRGLTRASLRRRRGRRTLCRRGRRRPGVPRPAGGDGPSVRAEPVLGRAPVPHRRPCAVAARRHARLPRPDRGQWPGEGPRAPGRGRGGGSGGPPRPGCPRRRRGGVPDRGRRDADGLRRVRRRTGTGPRPTCAA